MNGYQVALDVKYEDDNATIGYVVFEDENSLSPITEGTAQHEGVAPYVPGSFYQRELPCLLTAIDLIEEAIGLIYIDANVWLGDTEPGLGKHLYDALHGSIPIIGVSKSAYNRTTNRIQPVLRPSSSNPLYVSSVGIDLNDACLKIQQMAGSYRLPDMIKRADVLSRSEA
ncbi:MAG: endonuclease V [Bacteroidia bacterium]|nr:endonuclease V [Bacteroidia bacterium]